MPGSSVQHCRNMHMGNQEQCYGTEDGEMACQVDGVDEGLIRGVLSAMSTSSAWCR